MLRHGFVQQHMMLLASVATSQQSLVVEQLYVHGGESDIRPNQPCMDDMFQPPKVAQPMPVLHNPRLLSPKESPVVICDRTDQVEDIARRIYFENQVGTITV